MNCDVFISYKHTDDNGNITSDHIIAEKLYNMLVSMGYTAFFSSDSLEKLGSSRYKADIDAALDTAKVMVVVLSKAEYATSYWIQYE